MIEQWVENEEWNAITDVSHGTQGCDVDKYILSKLLCHFFSYSLLEKGSQGGRFNFLLLASCIKNDESK